MMMKSIPYFMLLLCVALLYPGCNNDDDDNDGLGGQDGDLRLTLTWQQTDADLDLDVISDPAGNFIGPSNFLPNISHSGDDLTGPGEEIIRFDNSAADGSYRIRVEWFNGSGEVRYTLRIQSADDGRTFNETINAATDEDFFEFTKTGSRLTF